MVCQVCEKKTARFHSQKLINNEVVQVHLCRECLEKSNGHELLNGIDDKSSFVFDGLLKQKDENRRSLARVKCPQCGTSIEDLRKTKLLGCSHCYSTFKNVISKDHMKAAAPHQKELLRDSVSQKLIHLKTELQQAVEIEDFEKAAELRDKIRGFESRGVAP